MPRFCGCRETSDGRGFRFQRLDRGIHVGRLRVVDEKHIVLAADLLHAVRQTREALKARLDLAEVEPDRGVMGVAVAAPAIAQAMVRQARAMAATD